MARVAKVKEQALVPWEEQLAREAEIAKGMEASAGGGNFFSLRGGIMSLNDEAMPDNQIACVVLDAIIENVFYDAPFDADNLSLPKCYAYGRNEATMKPHDDIFARGWEQHDTCTGCPQSEWGSAERGKGKACANRRRLSVISAGKIVNGRFEMADDDYFATSPVALLKLPVMSVKLYANYVRQLANTLQVPPIGVFSLIKVVPDARAMFLVTCQMIDKVPGRLIPILMKRRADTQDMLMQPYNLNLEEEEPAPVARRGVLPNGRSKPQRRAKY